MKIYSFEKLEVWQNARVLAKHIYLITKNYPEEEKFCLTNQMRRAAISISSNIAEGSGRTSNKDFAHFVQISYGSLLELLNQLILSLDLEYIDELTYSKTRSKIEEISNKLNSLRNYLLNK
jgi:four helix bundle protein